MFNQRKPQSRIHQHPGARPLSTHDKIDVCRGLFAFLVVLAHSLELAWTINPEVPGRLPWLTRRVLENGFGNGIFWVMGFFVISGYCIYLSAERLVDGNSFPLRQYLTARVTRIVPLYYIALLFTGVVEWWIAAGRPMMWPNGLSSRVFLYQLLFIQNFTETYGCYAPSWSITNEAFYYVYFGLIVFAAVRLSKWPAAIGMGTCMLIGVAAQLVHRLGYRSPAMMQFGLLFGLGINWFLGAIVAEHRDWLVHNRTVQAVAKCWPVLLALTIGLWCTQRVHLEFVFVSSGLAFTLMLVQFLISDEQRIGNAPKVSGPERPIVAMLGLCSYPTYLFHGPMLTLFGWFIVHWKLNLDWRLTWAFSAIIAIACGIALGYLAEKPILAWRAALLRRQKPVRRDPVYGAVERPILGINR